MDYNSWYFGHKLCTIRPDRILAPSMQRNKNMTAQVMQGAFNVYYQGFQAAQKVTDVLYQRSYSQAAQKQIRNMRSALESDLKSACCTGWYDLYFTFKDIAANNGNFKDDTWDGYKGICNIPMGVSNFLGVIESKGGQFANSVAEFNRAQSEAKRLAEAGRWSEVGEVMEKVKGTIEDYGPYLWVCIPGNPGTAPPYVEKVAKILGYAGQIHGALSKGLKAEQNLHAMKFDPNFKQDVFVETLAAVVGRLPIMGPLYAEVIRNVPNAIQYFKKIARERDAMIEQIMR